MDFIKLKRSLESSDYDYCYASSKEMNALGTFLCFDVGFDIDNNTENIFHEWAEADKNDPRSKFTYAIGGNVTFLEELDDGYIYITEAIGSLTNKANRNEIKILRQQFIQLLDDWKEKVCKLKPKEVIITYDNDQFSIEIND
jgi:hypothetical protein